jgi:hypothetical protein
MGEGGEHLGFARVVRDSQTGNQVASSADRADRDLGFWLDLTPVDEHRR